MRTRPASRSSSPAVVPWAGTQRLRMSSRRARMLWVLLCLIAFPHTDRPQLLLNTGYFGDSFADW